MNKGEEELFTVGELARKCGVTVRTLQYYDSTGLLAPSDYSEGGRRMYSKRDILRLHQILFLKSVGFSLEEIRDRLLPTDSAAELENMFQRQKGVLSARISSLQESVNLMETVIKEIKLGSEISIEKIFAIISATKLGNPYSFMIRHLNKEQMAYFYDRFDNENMAIEFEHNLQALTAKVMELYRRNADPEGSAGQDLAARWWDLVLEFTKGDPALIQKMFEVGANENSWPSDVPDLKEAVTSFLGRALSKYLTDNNINLPFGKG